MNFINKISRVFGREDNDLDLSIPSIAPEFRLHPPEGFAENLPSGWMNQAELEILYRVGSIGENILEVGTWVGRSTCAIANGVRDRQVKPKRFDIVDYGITGEQDWYRRFNTSINKDPEFQVVNLPGGLGGQLMQNLADRDLLQFVNLVILGDMHDIAPSRKYETVILDILHHDEEIRTNMPMVLPFLADEFVIIADDVLDDEHAAKIAAHLGEVKWQLSRPTKPYSKLGIFCTPAMQEHADYFMNG